MYTLHCFAQSGNAFKVAFFLNALHAPWRARHVDFFTGVARTPEWREQMNEMGEIPILDTGERRLTQSGAILTFLAEEHGRFGSSATNRRSRTSRCAATCSIRRRSRAASSPEDTRPSTHGPRACARSPDGPIRTR